MKKLTWGIFAAAILWLITLSPNAAAQTFTQQCRTGETCIPNADGTTTCNPVSHCWWLKSWGGFIYTYQDAGTSSIQVPHHPMDQQPDAVMDCWKGVTDNARQTSGFPFRNNGTDIHNGIDAASDSTDYGSYGRGAPIRSLGTGIVSEVNDISPDGANGKFVRVDQGDGIQMTYLHLLDFKTADGRV